MEWRKESRTDNMNEDFVCKLMSKKDVIQFIFKEGTHMATHD